MARWHWCGNPDVVVVDGRPRCQSCHASPRLDELMAQASAAGSGLLRPPPDEPPGQLNLRWPPTVPYARSSDASGPDTSFAAAAAGRPERDNMDTEEAAQNRPQATTGPYQPLAVNEFRLLSLSPARYDGDPIHARVDVYADNACPEYEALSYTRGGEDGDASLCSPVFLGPHWDVVAQTRSCAAALRYLRPTGAGKGVRVVWVDALCINQLSPAEKGPQVAKMSRIYSECSRVVVYLGPDIVAGRPQGEGGHPSRHALQALQEALNQPEGEEPHHQQQPQQQHLDLSRVLGCRYFTRVWVIQELILPRLLLLPIGGKEFFADFLTPDFIETTHPGWSWAESAAPWLQYMCERALVDQGFLDIVRLACRSQAEDPRDLVFGLLGLVTAAAAEKTASPIPEAAIEPDYTLSCQHVFTGIFAHALLKLQDVRVLRHASGISGWGAYPSWIPAWKTPATMFRDDSPDLQAAEVATWIAAWSARVLERAAAESTKTLLQKPGARIKGDVVSIMLQVSTAHRKWTTVEGRWLIDDIDGCYERTAPLTFDHYRSVELSVPASEIDVGLQCGKLWHQQAEIDVAGELRINLTHILRFSSRLTLVDKLGSGGSELTAYEVSTPSCGLYLISQDRLDQQVRPGWDHLFLLDKGDGDCFFLILRQRFPSSAAAFRPPSTIGRDDGLWMLVATCVDVRFRLSSHRAFRNTNVHVRRWTARPTHLFLADLQRPLADTVLALDLLQGFPASLPPAARLIFQQLFPRVRDFRLILPALVALADKREGRAVGPAAHFASAYARSVDGRFCARVSGGFVELRLGLHADPDLETAYWPDEAERCSAHVFTEWRYPEETVWRRAGRECRPDAAPGLAVVVRAPLERAVAVLVQTDLYRVARMLSNLPLGTRCVLEPQLLPSAVWAPGTAHARSRWVACPRWPDDLVDEFGIDGHTYTVRIA